MAAFRETPPKNHLESRVPVYLNRYALLMAWILIIIIFGILQPELFLRPRNFLTIFSERSILLILTLGMLPGLAAGEYDLSAASTMGLSFVVLGWLNVIHGWPVAPAIVLALLAALVVGIINALVIVVLDVPSIVATLGMATLLAGTALGINNLIVSGISPVLSASPEPRYSASSWCSFTLWPLPLSFGTFLPTHLWVAISISSALDAM